MPIEPSTTRRTLLAAFVTLPAAGCLDGDSPGTTTPPEETASATVERTDDRSTDEPATLDIGDLYSAGDYTVRASNPQVRHGIVEFGTTHPDPRWANGAQFLVVDLAVESGDQDPATLDVWVDTDRETVEERYFVFSSNASESLQSVGFPIQTTPDLGAVWVRLRGEQSVRWRLPSDVVSKLRHAPDFTLESFEVPDSAPPETDVEVVLSVGNDGDRDGRFLAEVGPAAMSDQSEVELPVTVGETATTTHTVPLRFFEGETAEVVLRWEGGIERRTVRRQ